ncbi:MAG: hypothetical protein U1F49_00030 [Rubrivivax sp.]
MDRFRQINASLGHTMGDRVRSMSGGGCRVPARGRPPGARRRPVRRDARRRRRARG